MQRNTNIKNDNMDTRYAWTVSEGDSITADGSNAARGDPGLHARTVRPDEKFLYELGPIKMCGEGRNSSHDFYWGV